MIDFLWEMRDFWIWCASLLVLTAVLWAVPRTRRMPGIFLIVSNLRIIPPIHPR